MKSLFRFTVIVTATGCASTAPAAAGAGSVASGALPSVASPAPVGSSGASSIAQSTVVELSPQHPVTGARGVRLTTVATANSFHPQDAVLTLAVGAQRGDEVPEPFFSGGSLRSGDKFWLELGATDPLYVYVLMVSSSGGCSVLYPRGGEMTVSPGPPERVPRDSRESFQLDGNPGLERLVVVASKGPLANVSEPLSHVVERAQTSGRWPTELMALPAAPPDLSTSAGRAGTPARASGYERAATVTGPTQTAPYPKEWQADATTRGVVLSHEGSDGTLDIVPDGSGIIVLPLFIRHLP